MNLEDSKCIKVCVIHTYTRARDYIRFCVLAENRWNTYFSFPIIIILMSLMKIFMVFSLWQSTLTRFEKCLRLSFN